MVIEKVVAKGWCIGCGMCAAVCPKNRLEILWNDRGEYSPIERSGCAACSEKCNLCFSVCPAHGNTKNETELGQAWYGEVEGIQHRNETGYYLASYIGHADRDHLHENGASGGMATWTLETLLESGEVNAVIAVGRTTNPEKLFEFCVCNTVEAIRDCSRSAYYPVEVSEVIRHVLQTEGRYAIIGLPCVCKAIRLAQEKFPKLKQRIRYVLGLTCGHTCGKYFAEYICALGGGDPHAMREFIFRTKSPNEPASNPGCHFRFGKGSEIVSRQVLQKEGVGFAFSNGYFQIPGCFYCDDVFAECADATFMDAWLPSYSMRPEGTSIILSRDSRVDRFFITGMSEGMPLEILPIDQVIKSQQGVIKIKRRQPWVHACRVEKMGISPPHIRDDLRKPTRSFLDYRMMVLCKRIADESALLWHESDKDLSQFRCRMRTVIRRLKLYYLLKRLFFNPAKIPRKIAKNGCARIMNHINIHKNQGHAMSHPKFLFIGNGQYQNRGCEAITLGTMEILRKAFGDGVAFVDMNRESVRTASPSWASDAGNYAHCPQNVVQRFSSGWWIRNGLRIFPKLRRRYTRYHDSRCMRPHIESVTAILSLGGDNYSLDYGLPYTFMHHGQFAKKHGIPFFIWGGSVGPFDDEPDFAPLILDHLRNEVTGIFTREKRSHDYLVKHGIQNVSMMSDPAFVMEPEPVSSDRLGFEVPDNAIGINLSPIMRKYCHQGDMNAWRQNAREIILAVLKNFDNPILLIPHVTIGSHNNDHLFMESCLEGIIKDKRVYSIDGRLDTRQTKWVISKLSCLIAARTHATIAAFSTCVPTVSLAYSVKAFGLNDMLFGHNDYLVPPDRLNANSVVSATKRVLENVTDVKERLRTIMPTVRENAYQSGIQLKRKLGETSLSSFTSPEKHRTKLAS